METSRGRKGNDSAFSGTGRQRQHVEVETPLLDVKAAWSSDALERNQGPLATSPHGFRFSVKPFQIVTVRVEGTGNLK